MKNWQEKLAPFKELSAQQKAETEAILRGLKDRLKAAELLRIQEETTLKISPEEKKKLQKEYVRKAVRKHRFKQYRITEEDFEALWTEQGGRCAICLYILTLEKAHIDHDHRTGIVRGVLCRTCNAGIGFLKDDPEVVLNAANYLASHNSLVERMLMARLKK